MCSDKRGWFYVCNEAYTVNQYDDGWNWIKSFIVYGAYACDTDEDLNLYVTALGEFVVCY